jgi:hypothetical protein
MQVIRNLSDDLLHDISLIRWLSTYLYIVHIKLEAHLSLREHTII